MLVLEVRGGAGWTPVGTVRAGDPPGSMSHNTPEGRQIIQFACFGDHSLIQRSEGGIDTEVGPLRAVTSIGFEDLARLGDGEHFETWLRTDRMQRPALFRFRHEA